LALEGPGFTDYQKAAEEMELLSKGLDSGLNKIFPLIVIADDSDFLSQSFRNFLWTVFTRSNPSHDIYGVRSFIEHKHWGCRGSLIIDARSKPHHAPALEPDPEISKKVDRLAEKGRSLHGII